MVHSNKVDERMLGDKMDTLRYFEYTNENKERQIILYNPRHITTYQARSAACYDLCFWADSSAGGEILRICDPEKFYRVFRSVLAFLEKCAPLDGAIAGRHTPEDFDHLKRICDELDAKEPVPEPQEVSPVEGDVHLRFIREPSRDYATAFDLRDIKDLHQAQIGSERYTWLDSKQKKENELRNALYPLYTLTCYDKVLANSDLPWLKEEKNLDTVVKERELENKTC